MEDRNVRLHTGRGPEFHGPSWPRPLADALNAQHDAAVTGHVSSSEANREPLLRTEPSGAKLRAELDERTPIQLKPAMVVERRLPGGGKLCRAVKQVREQLLRHIQPSR